MRILPSNNYQMQNTERTNFRGSSEEAKAVLAQITKGMAEINIVKPGRKELLKFYQDFYANLLSQKSHLLKNVEAMNSFVSQVLNMGDRASEKADLETAKEFFLFIKEVAKELTKNRWLQVSDDVIKGVDKRIADLGK